MKPRFRMTETKVGTSIKYTVTLDWKEEIEIPERILANIPVWEVRDSTVAFFQRSQEKLIADLTHDFYLDLNSFYLDAVVDCCEDAKVVTALRKKLEAMKEKLRGKEEVSS